MWATILKYAVKVALFAAEHPNDVKFLVDALVAARKK